MHGFISCIPVLQFSKRKKKEGMKKKEKKEGRVVYPEARIGEKGQRKEVGLMVR